MELLPLPVLRPAGAGLKLLDGACSAGAVVIAAARGIVFGRWREGRAEYRIPKLRAMLEIPVSLRLKPRLWGTMERRGRHEAALARCEFIVSEVTVAFAMCRWKRYRRSPSPGLRLKPRPRLKPHLADHAARAKASSCSCVSQRRGGVRSRWLGISATSSRPRAISVSTVRICGV